MAAAGGNVSSKRRKQWLLSTGETVLSISKGNLSFLMYTQTVLGNQYMQHFGTREPDYPENVMKEWC